MLTNVQHAVIQFIRQKLCLPVRLCFSKIVSVVICCLNTLQQIVNGINVASNALVVKNFWARWPVTSSRGTFCANIAWDKSRGLIVLWCIQIQPVYPLKIQPNVVLDVMEQYFKPKKWLKRELVTIKDVLLAAIVIVPKLTNYKYLWASIHNCIVRRVTRKFGIHLCL